MYVIIRINVSSTMSDITRFCNFNIVGIELAVIALNHRKKGVFLRFTAKRANSIPTILKSQNLANKY